MLDKILTRLYDIFEKEKKMHPTMRSYFVCLFLGALSAAVFTALRAEPTASQALMWFDVMFSALTTTLLGTFILVILYASSVYWHESKKGKDQKNITVKETDDDTEPSDLPHEDELAYACVRLSSFLKTVDYRKVNVPIGVRFEDRSRGNCIIQWSLDPVVQPIRITGAGLELNKIIDRLELEQAIPIDEEVGYTAP